MCQDASHGPDWTDVRHTMKGIEEAHDCVCSLLLLPDGRKDGTSWCIIAGASVVGTVEHIENSTIAISVRWPNSEHSTLVAAVFQAFYTLDYQCARRLYEQGKLWE
jgi:hypothetical protein